MWELSKTPEQFRAKLAKLAERRIGFRHLPGWYEDPYDVLRHVYRRLGEPKLAAKSHAKFAAAKAHRWAAVCGDIGPAARLSQPLAVAIA